MDKRCLFEPTPENSWKDIGCFQRITELGSKLLLVFGAFFLLQVGVVISAVIEAKHIRDKRTAELAVAARWL